MAALARLGIDIIHNLGASIAIAVTTRRPTTSSISNFASKLKNAVLERLKRNRDEEEEAVMRKKLWQKLQHFFTTCISIVENAPRSSLVKRVIKAVLCGLFTDKELAELSGSSVPWHRNSRMKARRDFVFLLERGDDGLNLDIEPSSDYELKGAVRDAVAFIVGSCQRRDL